MKQFVCKTFGFKEKDREGKREAENIYNQYKAEIEKYAGAGKKTVGSVFELADFFLKKQDDIAMHRMLFQIPSAEYKKTDENKHPVKYSDEEKKLAEGIQAYIDGDINKAKSSLKHATPFTLSDGAQSSIRSFSFIPLTTAEESSVEYFFASSTASSTTTLTGASFTNKSSVIAILKISLSILTSLEISHPLEYF